MTIPGMPHWNIGRPIGARTTRLPEGWGEEGCSLIEAVAKVDAPSPPAGLLWLRLRPSGLFIELCANQHEHAAALQTLTQLHNEGYGGPLYAGLHYWCLARAVRGGIYALHVRLAKNPEHL